MDCTDLGCAYVRRPLVSLNKVRIFILSLVLFFANILLANVNYCHFEYLKPEQKIVFSKLDHLVDYHNEWYEIVLPTERGFEYKKIKSWADVVESFSDISSEKKDIIKNLLWHSENRHEDIVNHFKPIAVQYKAEFRTRIKNIDSLRRKIMDRAAAVAKENQHYELNELNDLIGIRFTLPQDSILLRFKTSSSANKEIVEREEKEFFAKSLGLEPSQILEVEHKGEASDIAKGRYYRAIHLAIRPDNETRIELQLMSKAMYIWHSWDHPTVYKSKISDPEYKARLKKYSQTWVRLISSLEDLAAGQIRRKDFDEVLKSIGVDSKTHPNMLAQIIDSRLTTDLDINYQDRIVIEKGKHGLIPRRDFYRTLSKLFQILN